MKTTSKKKKIRFGAIPLAIFNNSKENSQHNRLRLLLDSRELLDIHRDGVPHLLQEAGDVVRGVVLVTGSF